MKKIYSYPELDEKSKDIVIRFTDNHLVAQIKQKQTIKSIKEIDAGGNPYWEEHSKELLDIVKTVKIKEYTI